MMSVSEWLYWCEPGDWRYLQNIFHWGNPLPIPKPQCFTGSNYLMDQMGYTVGVGVGASPIIHLKWAGKIGVSRSGQPSCRTATSRVLSIAGETKYNDSNAMQSIEKQCNPMELEVQCKSMQCCHQQSEGQCAKLSYSLIQSDYKQTHMLCSAYYHELYDKVCLECMNVKEHNI